MAGETVITHDALQMMQQESFSKYLLDSTALLESIKHFLKGEEREVQEIEVNGDKRLVEVWVLPKGRKPPINERGYHYVMKILNPLMDKSTATGNISLESANKMVEMTVNTLSEGLVIHHDEFGLEDENDIDSIIDPILNQLIIHYSKSVDMKMVTEIFRTYNVSEIRNYGEKEKKPNMTI